jgi:hypothetical protein
VHTLRDESIRSYFFAGFSGAGCGIEAGAGAGAGVGAGGGVTAVCAGGGEAACFFSQPKKATAATMTRTKMAAKYFFTMNTSFLSFDRAAPSGSEY